MNNCVLNSQQIIGAPLIDHRQSKNLIYHPSLRKKFKYQYQDFKQQQITTQYLTGSSKKDTMYQAEWFQKARVKQQVLKFIQNIKRNAYFLSTENIKKNLLQEKYLSTESNNQVKQMRSNANLLPMRSRTFQPDNPYIIVYDIISILSSLLTLWYYPFYISFYHSTEFEDPYWKTQIYLIMIIAFDIFMQCNKATIQLGEIILDRIQIMKYYFRAQGSFDLSLIIFWIVFMLQSNIIIQSILFLVIIGLVIKRTYHKIIAFEETQSLRNQLQDFCDLIILIIVIYYFAHITGCLWHYVGSNADYQNNWISKYSLSQSSVTIRYNQAFYWSTMTMTTIGYGDITAANPIETAYSSIMMFFSSCIFAYSVNQIGTIIKNINDNSIKFRRSLLIINQYMKKHSVNQTLQSRIRNYLKQYVDQQNNNMEATDSVIQNLPQSLKQELNQDIKLRILNYIPLIAKNFSSETIQRLAQHLSIASYTPQEIIPNVDKDQSPFLLYVIDGNLTIHEQKSNFKLYDILKENTMNQYDFMTGLDSQQKIISKSFTSLCRLNRKDFIQVLQSKTSDYEKFCQIRDQLQFQQDLSIIQYNCSLCKSDQHQLQLCPIIQYQPSIEKLIKRENFSSNERKYVSRLNYRRRMNSLIQLRQYRNLSLQSIRQSQTKQQIGISSQYDLSITQNKLPVSSIPLLEPQFLSEEQYEGQTEEENGEKNFLRIKKQENLQNRTKLLTQEFNNVPQIKTQELNQNIMSFSNLELSQTQTKQLRSQPKEPESFDIDRIQRFQQYHIKDNIDEIVKRRFYKPNEQLQNLIQQSARYLFRYSLQHMSACRKYRISKLKDKAALSN